MEVNWVEVYLTAGILLFVTSVVPCLYRRVLREWFSQHSTDWDYSKITEAEKAEIKLQEAARCIGEARDYLARMEGR